MPPTSASCGRAGSQCRHVPRRDPGWRQDALSLQANALDFFADAANYRISLFVVGMALRYRVMAALTKLELLQLKMALLPLMSLSDPQHCA
jgi:hypothetical protein